MIAQVKFLIDENVSNSLHLALRRRIPGLDITRVGAIGAPGLGTRDPEILAWCERSHRGLVTLDRSTMPRHLVAHLAAGGHSAGVFVIRRHAPLRDIIEHLALIAEASEPTEWMDRLVFLPW